MKKVNIKYFIKSFERFDEEFQHILSIFSDKDISHLEIDLVMDTLNNSEIEKIVNSVCNNSTIKDISGDTVYTFTSIVSPSRQLSKILIKLRGLLTRIYLVSSNDNFYGINEACKSLQKRNLPCVLLIREKDFDNIIGLYRKGTTLGVPIFVEDNINIDDNYISLFTEWLYDKNGCWINIFTDVLSRILLDYWGTKCQFKSCLSKKFLIDTDGNVYSCKKRENMICNLQDVSSINDIISNENFTSLLKCAMLKRKQCKELCSFYDLCQGGCPINSDITIEECENKQLFSAMKNITEHITSIIRNTDYGNLNPAVKNMILSSVASNKIFEKGLIV